MSYTLNGRIESRLAAAVPALLVALALHRWWAIELVALMLAVGLLLDVLVYHRALAYQPGWVAVPLGALELGVVIAGMHALHIAAPLRWALGLYALAWLSGSSQDMLSSRACGSSTASPAASSDVSARSRHSPSSSIVVGGLGGAYAVRPPTVHLHGVVHGPLVIRHAQTLVGGTVQGGILIRADHVTLRDVTVEGGENGIDVLGSQHVMLDGVHVSGVALDGIHVRQSSVMIRDCTVTAPKGPWVQGIDISFSMDKAMSMVEGCTINGVREGIVTHMTMVDVEHNTIGDTSLRAITMGEMSMGAIRHNDVRGARGVGIFCVDHSECEIEHNTVVDTHVDPGGDPTRSGVAIEAHYFAQATLKDNTVAASPGGIAAFDQSTLTHK